MIKEIIASNSEKKNFFSFTIFSKPKSEPQIVKKRTFFHLLYFQNQNLILIEKLANYLIIIMCLFSFTFYADFHAFVTLLFLFRFS